MLRILGEQLISRGIQFRDIQFWRIISVSGMPQALLNNSYIKITVTPKQYFWESLVKGESRIIPREDHCVNYP